MKKFLLIDARCSCIQTYMFEQADDTRWLLQGTHSITNRSSLKEWRKNWRNALEQLHLQATSNEVIFLPPEEATLHLILDLKGASNLSFDQKITKVLSKNYGINVNRYVFKYCALGNEKYSMTLIPKKFFRFLIKTLTEIKDQFFIFSPFACLYSYYKNHFSNNKSSLVAFIDNHKRSFFVEKQGNVEFLEFKFLQKASEEKSEIPISQLITQAIDLTPDLETFTFIGEIPPQLLKLYQQEFKKKCRAIGEIEEIFGLKENLSLVHQALFTGALQLVQHSEDFNFANIHLNKNIYQRMADLGVNFLKKHHKFCQWFSFLLMIFSFLFFTHEFYSYRLLSIQRKQSKQMQQKLKELDQKNKYLQNRNAACLFFPNVYLKHYEWLQTLSKEFCVDQISFLNEEEIQIKGRVALADFEKEVYEVLQLKLKKSKLRKVKFETDLLDKHVYTFTLCLPEKVPSLLKSE